MKEIKIQVVGKAGVGKTTLVRLIENFLRVSEMNVEVEPHIDFSDYDHYVHVSETNFENRINALKNKKIKIKEIHANSI